MRSNARGLGALVLTRCFLWRYCQRLYVTRLVVRIDIPRREMRRPRWLEGSSYLHGHAKRVRRMSGCWRLLGRVYHRDATFWVSLVNRPVSGGRGSVSFNGCLGRKKDSKSGHGRPETCRLKLHHCGARPQGSTHPCPGSRDTRSYDNRGECLHLEGRSIGKVMRW
jgi:hypothetical protein